MTTPPAFDALPPPLRLDETGTIRVGDTRVTLDTIVSFFDQGFSAEGIAAKFPTVGLANVYLTIGGYLNRRAEFDPYLEQRRKEAAEIEAALAPFGPPAGLRQQLIERLQKRAAS